ncbi:MAG: hypothetical protein ACYDEY_04305 [Acidimicrobiales bacterium]
MTGLLAGAMLMLGGGIGVVVALSTSSAGASTAHSSLPPVNVNVTNPSMNVNVTNPVQVASPASTGHGTQAGPWMQVPGWVDSQNSPQVVGTIANVSGPGVFKGFMFNFMNNCECNWEDGYVQVSIDGNTVLGEPISYFGWPDYSSTPPGLAWYGHNSVIGGNTFPAVPTAIQGYFWPPGGLPFQHSLVITIQPAWWQSMPNYINMWGQAYYSTTG